MDIHWLSKKKFNIPHLRKNRYSCCNTQVNSAIPWCFPHVRGGVSGVLDGRVVERMFSPRPWGCFSAPRP